MTDLKLTFSAYEIEDLIATCQEGATDTRLDLRSRYIMHSSILPKALKLKHKQERAAKLEDGKIKLHRIEALVLLDYLKEGHPLSLVDKLVKITPGILDRNTFIEQ